MRTNKLTKLLKSILTCVNKVNIKATEQRELINDIETIQIIDGTIEASEQIESILETELDDTPKATKSSEIFDSIDTQIVGEIISYKHKSDQAHGLNSKMFYDSSVSCLTELWVQIERVYINYLVNELISKGITPEFLAEYDGNVGEGNLSGGEYYNYAHRSLIIEYGTEDHQSVEICVNNGGGGERYVL